MFDLSSLKDILDEIMPPPLINNEDRLSLLEMTGELIDEYVKSNPLMFAEPGFHEKLRELCACLSAQLSTDGCEALSAHMIHSKFFMFSFLA